MLKLPRLYSILDAEALSRAGLPLGDAAAALRDAGVRWVQYRDKSASDEEVLQRTHLLRSVFPRGEAVLLVNDRVHLCAAVAADGVHIGQQDMPPEQARSILGPQMLLGISTHNVAQLRAAAATGAADYLAIGPVFTTASKRDPDPVVGLAGVAAARTLTQLPLVAIGGITGGNARSVRDAGADAVAVISGLLPDGGRDMAQSVRDFLALLR